MTFQEWFNRAPHRAKYSGDHPAYLAAQEAWKAAHEACAKVCDEQGVGRKALDHYAALTYSGAAHNCATAIRARGNT